MATVAELLASPLPMPESHERDESVIVVDDSDDEEPTVKRRRTSSDSTEESDVIDLTEADEQRPEGEGGEVQIKFRILPKLMRLAPFQFNSEDVEPDTMPLSSLRDHLRRLFGSGDDYDSGDRDSPSPIDPDELEITGVKESTAPSSSSTSTSTTSTSSSSSSSSNSRLPKTSPTNNKTQPQTSTTPPGKEKGVNLECPICLGEMKDITATTCGHIFCKECIKTAIQVTKCCPLCKKKLTARSIHPIYI